MKLYLYLTTCIYIVYQCKYEHVTTLNKMLDLCFLNKEFATLNFAFDILLKF